MQLVIFLGLSALAIIRAMSVANNAACTPALLMSTMAKLTPARGHYHPYW